MGEKIADICTLTLTGVRRIDGFLAELAKKAPKLLTPALESSLKELKGFADEAVSARDSLQRQRDRVKFPRHADAWRRKFESCRLPLTKPQAALRHRIPDGQDDFTFYLEKEDEIAALRALLVGGVAAYAANSVAFEKTPSERVTPGKADHELDSALRRHALDDIATKHIAEGSKLSYDQELWLWDKRRNARGTAAKGRALACPCDRARRWSVTFRMTERWPAKGGGPIFLNEIKAISGMLRRIILGPKSREKHGLVVIAGRTASCKSNIAKKLIEGHLNGVKDKRGLHFPTFEDPIERHFELPDVSYTPREKGRDVSNLAEAISNALRQKPAVMFIGETRDPAEWELLLKFAGTGHLVVTTAHAGSLVEAMGNILQATRAGDPTARSEVGERLLAVVHLKPSVIEGRDGQRVGVLLPAVWRRTTEGIKALMAEGLSSLMPNTPGPLPSSDLPSSIGRYWFARELLKEVTADARGAFGGAIGEGEMSHAVKTAALEWDMEGV